MRFKDFLYILVIAFSIFHPNVISVVTNLSICFELRLKWGLGGGYEMNCHGLVTFSDYLHLGHKKLFVSEFI